MNKRNNEDLRVLLKRMLNETPRPRFDEAAKRIERVVGTIGRGAAIKVGECFKCGDWVMQLNRITKKDFVLRGQVRGVIIGAEVNLGGRMCRIRKVDGCFVYCRPLVGLAAPCKNPPR